MSESNDLFDIMKMFNSKLIEEQKREKNFQEEYDLRFKNKNGKDNR